MGLLDRFFKKGFNNAIFSFMLGTSAPQMTEEEYNKAYRGVVYACVNAIADFFAHVDIHLVQKKPDGTRVIIDTHPAMQLLNKVNPVMSSTDLKRETMSFLEINGNHFWYIVRSASGTPVELWPLDPSRITINKGTLRPIDGYTYRNAKGENVSFKFEEVLQFKRFNPKDQYRGMGTIEAAALQIDIDTYSAEWNRNFFFNSARPDTVLKTDAKLDKDVFERVKKQWNQEYGGVNNAHKTAILEGGLDVKFLNMSQKDMDFLEQRKFSRDEILSIFRVPKSIIGIVEDVNRANAEASEYVFAKWVMKPKVQLFIDVLNEMYLPMFGLDTSQYEFTFDDFVPENEEIEIKKFQTGIQSGYYTINEVRAEEDLPPIEGGDVAYIPINYTPLGAPITPQKSYKLNSSVIRKGFVTKAFIDKRVNFIKTTIRSKQRIYKDIYLEQKAVILKELTTGKKSVIKKGDEKDILKAIYNILDTQAFKKFVDENKSTYEEVIQQAGTEAINQLDVDQTFNLKNPRATGWMEKHSLDNATSIVGTLKDKVGNIVTARFADGGTVDQIRDDISGFFDSESSWRAMRIARTEVISSYAEGSLEGYRQSEVVKMKKWLTAGDGNVDPECEMNEADGAIALSDTFSSGDDAPPLHPNCRCVLAPDVGID